MIHYFSFLYLTEIMTYFIEPDGGGSHVDRRVLHIPVLSQGSFVVVVSCIYHLQDIDHGYHKNTDRDNDE